MFCIAAFIILMFMAAFSAKYRSYLKQAWACTFRRITLRPCDTSFKDQIKNSLIAKVAVRAPRLSRVADIGLEVAAFLVIIITIWSLYVMVKGGLNFFVYDTCYPSNAAACSLGAEACSIGTAKISFIDSVQTLKVNEWVAAEYNEITETIAAIPARLQAWNPQEYAPQNATYFSQYQEAKPAALEIIDPGCLYCRQLNQKILDTDFGHRYNLTYIAYPIPNGEGGYKFPHSYRISSHLEAMKMVPLEDASMPTDWQVLERIFTEKNESGYPYQDVINTILSDVEVEALLDKWMRDFGYNQEQINQINRLSESSEVKDIIQQNSNIVTQKIKTVKIPTILFDGKRFGGVVDLPSK